MPATAPPPLEENQRLAALHEYEILDTDPQEAFDRLTRLAAEVVGTPLALISLVDADRQWFKSKVGVQLTQTPRNQAFCAIAIGLPEPLVVPDARLDPRFADSALVVGAPHIRFYAGAQLISPEGHCLGTLCTMDTVPRQISADQLRHLTDLAGAVVTTMELHRTLRTLERQAGRDPLTGLPNRMRLIQRIQGLLTQRPHDFRPFALLYLGCDDLKEVNDTMGRQTGDLLLRSLGQMLPEWVRPTDAAARVDGDEFALLLPATHERAAQVVAHRVLEEATALMLRHDWPVTLSIGAVSFTAPPDSADQALSIADGAMSEAKLRGKRQVRHARYPAGAGEPAPAAHGMMQQALRGALDRQELFLCYQPVVPIQDPGRAWSAEALVRWRHPTLGILPPSSFVPGAEKSGLILPLGEAVLGMAINQMRTWLHAGAGPARVSVNVAALQLRSADFGASVLRRLEEAGVPAERLIIELTEGTLIDGSGTVLDTLMTLVRGGVRLAIDDFGTGYSSLRYLRNLPVHALKIDRTFVEDITTNPRDSSIVAAVVAMARTLRLTTVAEGVETPAQRDRVTELGCDYGQGWLFGRPVAAAELDLGLALDTAN